MLQGKTAIVTGSTSGIGLAIAEALAAAGCNLMLNGFGDPGEIEKLRAGIAQRHRIEAAYGPADMSRPAEIRDLVAATARRFGGIDILVNNAGIQHVAKVVDFPEERWDAVIAINLSAAFHAAKAALPHMIGRRWGRIINIASAHGLVGLTKVIAIEAANSGVTCNAICPGWVLTSLVERQIEARAAAAGIEVRQAREDLVREKQPMLEFTTPQKIGAFAVFLCGEDAATITGAALSIDGGWVAQ